MNKRVYSTLCGCYHFQENKSYSWLQNGFTELTLVFLFSYLRYHCPMPKIFYVQLTVGNNEFFGEGKTRQAARHNAAMKALQALQNEPIPEKSPQVCCRYMWQSLPCSSPVRLLTRQINVFLKIKEIISSDRKEY